MTSAVALFDALSIVSELDPIAEGASNGEVGAFAYLACLLYAFAGNDPSSWGYAFVATPKGAPVSSVLAEATNDLRLGGFLELRGPVNWVTALGSREIQDWGRLDWLSRREGFLRGACGAALLLSPAVVTDSLSLEPQLSTATALHSTRSLLDEPGRLLVEPHFNQLRIALGATRNSIVPAVIWLRYLAEARLRTEATTIR